MTKKRLYQRHGSVIVMDRRDPNAYDGKCELCGAVEELRPFGPNNENICYACGMKDEATTSRKFAEMFGQAD